jgi:hypothetical protein
MSTPTPQSPNKQLQPEPGSHSPLFWISVAGITSGLAFLFAASGVQAVLSGSFWEDVFKQLGIALIIVSTVSIVFDKILHYQSSRHFLTTLQNAISEIRTETDSVKETLTDVSTVVQESLGKLSNVSNILRGAHESQIESIGRNRREVLKDMIAEIGQSKETCVLGISLRGFFISAGEYFGAMQGIFQQIKNSTDKRIRNESAFCSSIPIPIRR